MKSNRTRKRCPDCPEQCFCGASQRLENNHLGGRKTASGIWLPYCLSDHAQFHANCRMAGVDFGKQDDEKVGKIQSLKAHIVGLWMVVESLEKDIKNSPGGRKP